MTHFCNESLRGTNCCSPYDAIIAMINNAQATADAALALAGNVSTNLGILMTTVATAIQRLDNLGSVMTYKGSVATYADLPATDNQVGDVYNVLSDGTNYAWDSTGWDQLGGIIDLSAYETVADAVTKLEFYSETYNTPLTVAANTEMSIQSGTLTASDGYSYIAFVMEVGSSGILISASSKYQAATSGSTVAAHPILINNTESSITGIGILTLVYRYKRPGNPVYQTYVITDGSSIKKTINSLSTINSNALNSMTNIDLMEYVSNDIIYVTRSAFSNTSFNIGVSVKKGYDYFILTGSSNSTINVTGSSMTFSANTAIAMPCNLYNNSSGTSIVAINIVIMRIPNNNTVNIINIRGFDNSPIDRSKLKSVTETTGTLLSNGWNSNLQTISVAGLLTTDSIIVAPSGGTSINEWQALNVFAGSIPSDGTLSFEYLNNITPSTDITVNIMIIRGA